MNTRIVAAAVSASLLLGGAALADVDFAKEIQPIIEKSCLKCHGPEKPKADLRLDIKEGLLKGSKGGPVVVAGKADESTLYDAITAPKDDPSHMPAEGEPLTQAQTDLIRDWINQGLKWPDALVLHPPAGAEPGKPAVAEPPTDPGVPISDAEKAAVAKLQDLHALAQRLAQNTNLLRVDFSLQAREAKDDDLAALANIPNLTELDLGNTNITDAGLAQLKNLPQLTRLKLHKTKITDAGLENLKGLQKLTSLNLYGTEISDAGLEHLKDLKNLRKLYVWQTKVTEEGAKKLTAAIPELVVDRGYELPPPEAAKTEPAKPDEPKKDDAAKKDAAKKDETKKEPAKKDDAKKEDAKKDETKKDDAKKDDAKKDDAKKDETKKEPAKQDAAKPDEAKPGPEKKDPAKHDAPKKDEAKKEEPKKDAAKPDAPKEQQPEKK